VSDLLRDSRHPAAAAAREQAEWLSYLELGGTAPATLYHYQWITDRLLQYRPDTPFDEFTDGDLLAVMKSFPAQSRRTKMAAFSNWFRWGRKTRRLTENPMDLLPEMKRERQPIIEVFTPAEEGALTSLPAPDGFLMTVLFEGGVRKSEARHLQVRRFDFDAGQVYVIDATKGGKQRVVPMSDKLQAAVSEFVLLEGLNPLDHLWASKPGGGRLRRDTPVSETTFVRWWTACIELAGVSYRKPHTTRHTFATRWRARGLALDDIQKLLGHESISTTSDLYVHLQVADIAERMRSLS
jgi:integrase